MVNQDSERFGARETISQKTLIIAVARMQIRGTPRTWHGHPRITLRFI
jgi:hypothetical protein